MNGRIFLALLVAVATGTAIALQSMLSGKTGSIIGPVRTGLLVNAAGGSLAIIVILVSVLAVHLGIMNASGLSAGVAGEVPVSVLASWVFLAGLLGIVIIGGISFSVGRVGVTAGLSAVILAQLVGGLVIDHVGGGGGIAITISVRRLLGVAAMAIGVWLLVPRTS